MIHFNSNDSSKNKNPKMVSVAMLHGSHKHTQKMKGNGSLSIFISKWLSLLPLPHKIWWGMMYHWAHKMKGMVHWAFLFPNKSPPPPTQNMTRNDVSLSINKVLRWINELHTMLHLCTILLHIDKQVILEIHHWDNCTPEFASLQNSDVKKKQIL